MKSPYRPVVLHPVDTDPALAVPPVFVTVRPLDLADLKRVLKRRMMRTAPDRHDRAGAEIDARLHATLADLLKDKRPPPEVVVVEWPPKDGIRLATVRLGDTLMLGAHLSADWADEALSQAARRTLDGALRAYLGTRRESYRTVPRR